MQKSETIVFVATLDPRVNAIERLLSSLGLSVRWLAGRLGTSHTNVRNWLQGDGPRDRSMLDAALTVLREEEQSRRPASQQRKPGVFQLAPVPDAMLPIVSRAGAGHWVEPFQCEDFEPVPAHLVAQDCFGVVVDGDSMFPFLHPGDIAIFKAERQPRLGYTVLARNGENELTIKLFKHNGAEFELVPINPAHPKATASLWRVEGVLVAYVRDIGQRRITDSDPSGLRYDPNAVIG